MLRGLVFKTSCLEYRLDVDGTASDSTGATTGVIGSLEGFYENSYLTLSTSFALAASRGFDPSGHGATLQIPEFFVSETVTFLTASPVLVRYRYNDVEIYADTTGTYKTKVGEIEWEVNGTIEWSTTGVELFGSLAMCPGSIPFLGIKPFGSSNVIIPNVAASTPGGGIGSGAFTAAGNAGVTVGWRYLDLDGVTWLTSSIDLDAPSVPSSLLRPTGSDCWSVSLPSEGANACNGTTLGTNHSQTVGCWLWPGESSELVKIENFESLIIRGELPQVQAKVIDTYFNSNPMPVGTTIDNSFLVDLHGSESQFLERVTNPLSTIEGPMSQRNYAPWRSHDRLETITNSDITRTTSGYEIGTYVDTPSLTPLNHLDPIARHWNNWNHRHPAYSPWFPPDDSVSTVRWPLNGAPSPIDYWYGADQQYIMHPALPSGSRTKHRVNVCSETLDRNGLLGLAATYLGMPCWWGINGFSIKERDYPEYFVTDETSEPRFSFLDGVSSGSGSVDSSGITLDVGDSIVFKLDSYDDWPRMAPSLADRLTVTSTDANFGGCNIYLRGFDESEVLLGSTTGQHRIKRGPSTEWASSAVFNFGQGELADTYSGIASSDGSTGIQDILRATSFGLLPGFSGESIRVEVIRINPANPVSIDHIRFDMAPWEDARAFHETGGITTILFKNGPMARFGTLSFYDYLFDTPISTPQVRGLSGAPTLGDLWAWENCFLLGIDAQDGIITRLQAEFVEDEEFTIVDHAWRDPFGVQTSSSGVWNSAIGPVFWYLNSYRSHYPLSWCGEKRRVSADGWQPTGDRGQWKYANTLPRHPVIVPGGLQPELVKDSINALAFESAPEGWSVGSHSLELTNSESYDWTIRWDNKDWLDVRPWRGFTNVFGLPEAAPPRGVWHLTTRDRRFLRSWADSTGAKVRWWEYHLPKGINGVSVISEAESYYQCRIYDDNNLRVHALISDEDGTIFRSHSDDSGKTWSDLEEAMAGYFATCSSSPNGDVIEAWFVYDSGTSGPGTIQYQFKGSGATSFDSVVIIADDSGPLKFEPTSFHMSFGVDGAGRVLLSALIESETEPSEWWSTDVPVGGGTFTRFT